MSPTTQPVLIPELVDATYSGKVIKSGDGFCFISDVAQGYATVETNGDVFCPMPFPEGATVEFDVLEEDHERSNARVGQKFRTSTARLIANPQGLVVGDTPRQMAKAEAIYSLTISRTAYHARSKQIAAEDVRRAAENGPFDTVAEVMLNPRVSQIDIVEAAENFLRAQFPTLVEMGLSCSLTADENEQTAETGLIQEAKAVYQDAGLDGQITSLEADVDQFTGVRRVFRMMNDHKLLKVDSIIPMRHLSDMMMAAPVWYGGDWAWDRIPFFCNAVGSAEFATLFQIYNRVPRSLSTLSARESAGRWLSDTMSPTTARLVKEATASFDFVIVATPYHDVASREWDDPNWRANIDPYLIGFQRGLDFMFLLARWSGTGLFPKVCDMVADTVNHLAMNKARLAKVGTLTENVVLYDVREKREMLIKPKDAARMYETFVDSLITAFERGELFPFLRGELKQEGATV